MTGIFIKKLMEGGSKKLATYITPKIKKDLTKRRKDQQEMFKMIDDKYKEAGVEKGSGASKIKKESAKKVSDIYDKYEKKAKGGRIGLKSGTNPFARKSNIKKIEEVFGPKQVKKKEKPKARMMAKKGSKPKKKFPDLTGDGQVTFADVLKGRGVINGKKKPKKKVI